MTSTTNKQKQSTPDNVVVLPRRLPPKALAPLCAIPHWVLWKLTQREGANGEKRFTKPPYQAKLPKRMASTADPDTWAPYELAAEVAEREGLRGRYGGVGFCIKGSGRGGIDLDKCFNDDMEMAASANEIVDHARKAGCYVEISPSGKGIHIWGISTGREVHTRWTLRDGVVIEIFRETRRFLTVTGQPMFEGDCAEGQWGSIDGLINELIKDRPEKAAARGWSKGSSSKRRRDNGSSKRRDDDDPDNSPSGIFHARVTKLTERGWSVEEIEADYRKRPEEWEDSAGERYASDGRKGGLLGEIERSASKAKRKPTGEGWPEPKPLPHGLAPVAAFDSKKFLPDALAPWVDDIADRLQCPPDYVGVSAVTALGSVIGRRVGIKPQAKTDWIEFPNLWSAFVGQPGMLKSPAMLQALAPLHRLEAEAAEDYKVQLEAYAKNLNAYKLKRQVWAALEKDALKKGTKAKSFDLDDAPEEPTAVRYRSNDTTYEKLGEILLANPTGILIERDELVSLLQHLDREEQAQARSFFMTGWAGTHPYTFDRIIRGSLHIEAVCLSLLGNTQPTRISGYVRRANFDGGGGDGLIQRFQLLVWPDAPPSWNDIDQCPDSSARRKAWEVFERMSRLDAAELHKLGAHRMHGDKTYHYRFTEPAREEFVAWREPLELRLRSGELSPALEGHFAKYRKLVPALALINHLSDGGEGPVGRAALRKALAFAAYLETHAQRVYGTADMVELAAAEAILAHVRSGDLVNEFTARDVHQRNWSNLTERHWVQAGLELLVDLDYLAANTDRPSERGGRSKTTYTINPRM
jgi:putative DNA primase/helicase